MVQDAIYCSYATENIGMAKWKATGPIFQYLEAEEKGLKE